MLNQLLNQIDEYLSNQPFQRRWWSRAWIVHLAIQPPISKDYPLWTRSNAELRLLRLFNLSPEALGRQIEAYWKKPRWRRWLASFGMNKKIEVWNYYQCCLAYQAVRSEVGKQSELFELGLVLYQFNVKFERYLEKRWHNPSWIEKHFLKEMKAYQQRVQKTFEKKLNKLLQANQTEKERPALKQHAEQEYQQVEVLMLRYYHLCRSKIFSRAQFNTKTDVELELVQDVASHPEHSLAVSANSQAVASSSPSTMLASETNQLSGIGSLQGAKRWIQSQRECLTSLIKEGSLQKVEELFQFSLNEIQTITEFYLNRYEERLLSIQGQLEISNTLDYVNNLQRQLKSLLQVGTFLFHPDHVMNLTHSKAMEKLITRYSQVYLKQSRHYLASLKKNHQRIETLYRQTQRHSLRERGLQDGSDLARRIQALGQSVKELKQSFKELDRKLQEFETRRQQDKEDLEAQLKEFEEKCQQDKEALEAQLKEFESKRLQDKAESETRQNESDKRIEELFKFMNEIRSRQPASTSSEGERPESHVLPFFKPN